MTTKLSQFFTLEELTVSQNAVRHGIDNTPKGEAMANLVETARKMDDVRKLLGKPIYVSSGYRNPQINAMAGSGLTSSHLSGLAVDFVCPEFGTVKQVFDAIRKSPIRFDQLIDETGWCHIGFGPKLRHEQLKAIFVAGKKPTYEVVK